MADGEQPRANLNRLAGETSPYLLAHARNPVDWYPWGPDALARAAEMDRPIFLSIGYAACHWCHVMERESFEDEALAAYLNAHFVPIKVDREERPDLDGVYMAAVQAMTGKGGWPLSVFLAPDGRPFFGGTYFPPVPRHGLPGFGQVLAGVHEAWQEQRTAVAETGAAVVAHLREARGMGKAAEALPAVEDLASASAALAAGFDEENGGWGGAPKFPQPMAIEFVLRRHLATGDPRPLAIARRALDRMADGGVHDQLGGGFHRYATDARWLVPHFEQMLYDNAQLSRVYLHAWQLTREPRYLEVVVGVLDFLLRELRTPGGGFAASLDADTDGVEGGTFTWLRGEVREVLGDASPLFEAAYGVTEEGNWEGGTILARVRSSRELSDRFGLALGDVDAQLAEARRALLSARSRRHQPARDDKVLAAWNGLAIAALADAARALDAGGSQLADRAAAYRGAAVAAARDVLTGLRVGPGRLMRSWKDGRATADGVLEDSADLADGLLALYEATSDERWFVEAVDLAEGILARFADPSGGFHDTAADAEGLVVRPHDLQDNATPSGSSMATSVLLRLAALTGKPRYRAAAERALARVGPYLARHPTAFANWLCALEMAHQQVAEVAIVGEPDAARPLIRAASRSYGPFRVLAVSPTPSSSAVTLMRDRFALHGRPTAFVCHDFACRQPVHEPEALEALLVGT
jgi:uncharacterized protein YyaL (SSP411 family)